MRGCRALLALAAWCLIGAAPPAGPLAGTFERLDHGRVTQTGLPARTKHVLVYYGASWCGPCRAFVPELIAAYPRLRAQGTEVLFVSDDPSCATALDYARSSRMPWLLLPCHRRYRAQLRLLGGSALPGIVVLDAEARIVRSSWTNPDRSAPRRLLAELLASRR